MPRSQASRLSSAHSVHSRAINPSVQVKSLPPSFPALRGGKNRLSEKKAKAKASDGYRVQRQFPLPAPPKRFEKLMPPLSDSHDANQPPHFIHPARQLLSLV
ncbi:hypothetical protein BC567DRAFT_225974, partial [Phyllosticta citribraziliensis]